MGCCRKAKSGRATKRAPKTAGRSLTLIMTHRAPKIRPAMTAIAAVIALSSTAGLAQSVDPAIATPAPAVEVTPAPLAAEPLAAQPIVPDTVAEPLPPEPAKAKSSTSTTTRRTASAARPAKAAPLVARAAVAAPVPAPAEPVAAAPVAVAAMPVAPAPAVAATPPAQDTSIASNALMPIAGAVGLGLLGLIGVALAMRRRKRRREEEFAAAEQYEPAIEAPAQTDPIFAEQPSAQSPAEPAPAVLAAASASAGSPSDCADAAPGSHVEAACDGPTEDNPSLSVKKRLKRARFFDEREQLAAAGLAVPVETDAGLPDAVEVPAPAQGAREPA